MFMNSNIPRALLVDLFSTRLIFLNFQVLKCVLGILMSTEFHEISHKCYADDYLLSAGHIISSKLYLYAIFFKKPLFFTKKSVSNFFGSHSAKIKLIFLIYTFFKTNVQKIGGGYFLFFFFKGFWASGC